MITAEGDPSATGDDMGHFLELRHPKTGSFSVLLATLITFIC